MRYSEPKALDNLFNDPSLSSMVKRSRDLSSLNRLLTQLLPDSLCQQCHIANYREGVLIIEVSSASWLTRLRYEQEKLRSLLRNNGLRGLSSIQFKINPTLNQKKYTLHDTEPALERKYLTQQSADHLLALAITCPPKLKENLINLAHYAKKSKKNTE